MTLGCVTMASPAVAPYPNTMLTTPAGSPASAMMEQSIQAVTLVISLRCYLVTTAH